VGMEGEGGGCSLCPWAGWLPGSHPVLAPLQQVCSRCPGPAQNSSLVAGYCSSRQDAVLRGRCCLTRGTRPAGLAGPDVLVCSDLTGNPLQSLPDGAFRGFTHLQTLALPPSLDCPGGSAVWDSVSTVGGSRTCRGQRSPCNGTAQPAWLCPENALCAADGPGLPQCLCAAPYHGYKCLRQVRRGRLPWTEA
uniref:All-trans retinoic acid induced differentiation factor n=1 Tax=Sphenodon punctatus TaxID=8508 RepID=A0A8D0HLE8_SPHPU